MAVHGMALGKTVADRDFRCLKVGGKKSGKETVTPVIPILCNKSFPSLGEVTTSHPDTGPNFRDPANSSELRIALWDFY